MLLGGNTLKKSIIVEKRPTILGSHFDYDDRYEESVE